MGKSSLFNLMIMRRLSIVEDQHGVTRDRLESPCKLAEGHDIRLVDTGGMGFTSTKADYGTQVEKALEEAEVLVLVASAREGVTGDDTRIASKLRKLGKPVVLCVNKADTQGLAQDVAEFYSLGLGDPIAMSVHENKGVRELKELLQSMTRKVGAVATEKHPRIVLVGRRNAGKSTLLNSLAGENRVIVSDRPGTTRDFVEVLVERGGKPFVCVDTAGVKHKNFEDSVEYFSMARTQRAIRESDAAILLMDATQKISLIDKKLSGLLQKESKPTLVVVNKWDLAPKGLKTGEYLKYLESQLKGLAFAPVVFISALRSERTRAMIRTMFDLIRQGQSRIGTGELNRLLQRLIAQRTPPRRSGRQLKLSYATQIAVSPPTFVFKVNDPTLATKSYRRYVENALREALGASEIPLRMLYRGRPNADD